MNGPTLEREIHFQRRGRGSRRVITAGPEPARPAVALGRVPRVARLMALAIQFDGLLRAGIVASYAELARLGLVTRARVSQIMNLLNLAPSLQEEILYLPAIVTGRAPIKLAELQTVAAIPDWKKQQRKWQELTAEKNPLASNWIPIQMNISALG